MKIFIAYTVRDGENTIEELKLYKDFFSSFGETFVDLIDNDSNDRQKRVENEVLRSDLFILVETPNTYSSEWVQKELDVASRNRIRTLKFPKQILLQLIKINS